MSPTDEKCSQGHLKCLICQIINFAATQIKSTGLEIEYMYIPVSFISQIYGRYTKDLGSFAKFQAKRVKKPDQIDFGKAEPKPRNRLWECIGMYQNLLNR